MRIQTEADFDTLLRGARLCAVAAAWTELGIWDCLASADGPKRLSELPGDDRALAITAPVLAHAGLLDGVGDQWKMSRVARQMHQNGELPTSWTLQSLEGLSRTPEVITTGEPVKNKDGSSQVTTGGVRQEDKESTRRFLDYLHRRSTHSAELLATWLTPRIPEQSRVIDIGGGHGRFGQAVADRGHTVTLFDLEPVIELAKERYADRLNYRVGNYHEGNFGGPYHAAILSNIVHSESSEDNAALLKRIYDALEPGGVLVIKDMFIDEIGRDPENAVFFGMTMLFYTANGRSHTVNDLHSWCASAGFEKPECIPVESSVYAFAKRK